MAHDKKSIALVLFFLLQAIFGTLTVVVAQSDDIGPQLSEEEDYLCHACEQSVIPLVVEAIEQSEAHHHPVETMQSLLQKILDEQEQQTDDEGRMSLSQSSRQRKKQQRREWLVEFLHHLLWDQESLWRLSAAQIVYHRYPDRRKHLDALLHYVACACGDHDVRIAPLKDDDDDSEDDKTLRLNSRRQYHQQKMYHLENRGFSSLLEKHAAVLRRLQQEHDGDDAENTDGSSSLAFSGALFEPPKQPSSDSTLESRLGMPGFGGMATGREQQGEEL